MSTLSPELTVGQIAAQAPASIRVFERYRIDFCCGGGAPLREASAARGLNAEQVLKEIEAEIAKGAAAGAETDSWQTARLGSLIDHILWTHHTYMKDQLPRIGAMLEKVVSKHGGRYGTVLGPLAEVFRAMREELEGHLGKEEMVLFPLIRRMEEAGGPVSAPCGSVRNPIRVMVMEHDSAGEGLAEIRQLTGAYTPPEDACNTFRALYFELSALEADLHRHIHLENNILFPRAVEMEASSLTPPGTFRCGASRTR